MEGEESIYLATSGGDPEPIFIVITKTHLTEKECSTSAEKTRWHLDSIVSCEVTDECVHLTFDTMRKDKKERFYKLIEVGEEDKFVTCMKNKISSRGSKNCDFRVKYQCMKCFVKFSMGKNVLGEHAIACPQCEKSDLVVEDV